MRLHFREYGQGPPLIILHGLFGSLDNWGAISSRLAGDFHVYAVDQRNHGGSPHSEDMNYRLMADDLREFMDDRALDRAHVLGHSMGGKTAMQFALQYGSRVDRLVVVDVAPRAYEPEHEYIFAALLALDLAKYRTRPEIEQALARRIPNLAVRRFLLKNLVRSPDEAFQWRFNLSGLHRNYSALAGGLEQAGQFDGPSFFIRGEKSDYVGDGDWLAIRKQFPKAEWVTVPGAGHWVHVEGLEFFVVSAKKFLGKKI